MEMDTDERQHYVGLLIEQIERENEQMESSRRK